MNRLSPKIQAVFGAALVAASLAIAGCATTAEETAPLPHSDETPVATPTPETSPEALSAFDANGNPYIPGSNRLLEQTLYFDYDRSMLGAESRAALEGHAEVLRTHPERVVVIEGHADERGTRDYNLALGERRADAVRAFLIAAGVAPRQIHTVSFGEERPLDAMSGESAWSRNRRAFMDYTNGSARKSQSGETVANR
jgi:peptidoglycan-associated lipoprotein